MIAAARWAIVVLAILVPLRANGACDAATIASLTETLHAEDDLARWNAASALGACGGDALPSLEAALRSDEARVRQGSARALGLIGDAQAVPGLVDALKDADPLVRERAAEALGHIGPKASAAVEALIATFAGDDPYVAGAASIALGRIGPAAVTPLADALTDAREDVRWSATIALARIGTSAAPASPALIRALGDANWKVRDGAVNALGAIGARDAVPALAELLYDRDENVRRSARTALRQIDPAWRAKPPSREEIIATIDRLVPALMEQHAVPGVAIALVGDGQVAWSKAYGVSDATKKMPVTNDTLFEAASMSKPVFAVVAMQLVDAKRLDLDRPLVEYASEQFVPDQASRRRITARMVLSHTSGYPNWRPGDEEREGPLPLLFEPGARFSYSGEGMFYLQRVMERMTRVPLDLRARESLFAPMGLEHSSFAWTPAVDGLLSSGHGSDGAYLTRSKYVHPNAAYTLYTTAEEYARILIEVMNAARGDSQVLSQKAAREMLRSQVALDAREPIERPGSAEGRSVHWGLGWSMNETAGGRVFHHSGANRTGFRCYSQFAPERRSGIVIMTNGLGGGELWTRVIAAVGDW